MKSKTADTDGTIIEFMQGSHSYDGIWFGEPHPILKGQFWWRTILREYLSSGKFHHPVPDEAPKEWEEQATKDYENGYESETSAIDKFVFADEAGEVYVWETKNPEQDLFRHPIINLTEKCHDLGWFDTKRGYWVDENGDSLGQCEWLRLSPAPPSGEDAGKGIGDLKQDLFDFFLWFRENGDLYIDKSIENMISIYIKTIHTNV